MNNEASEGGTEMADAEDAEDEADDSGSDGHDALDPEDLQYPEFVFEDGEISEEGAFDLERTLDREEMQAWLEDLAGGLASHDIAVESPDGYVTFGVAPEAIELAFDPEEDLVGDLEFTVRMKAKPMFVADDPDGEKVGARGGKGFVPIEMLTEDRETYRCYNWIEDPSSSERATDGSE